MGEEYKRQMMKRFPDFAEKERIKEEDEKLARRIQEEEERNGQPGGVHGQPVGGRGQGRKNRSGLKLWRRATKIRKRGRRGNLGRP